MSMDGGLFGTSMENKQELAGDEKISARSSCEDKWKHLLSPAAFAFAAHISN
ncbi:MAG: hypothetical protein ACLVKK_11545 [Ruthenibacterium sp.]